MAILFRIFKMFNEIIQCNDTIKYSYTYVCGNVRIRFYTDKFPPVHYNHKLQSNFSVLHLHQLLMTFTNTVKQDIRFIYLRLKADCTPCK